MRRQARPARTPRLFRTRRLTSQNAFDGMSISSLRSRVVSCSQLECEKYDPGDTSSPLTAVRPVTAFSNRRREATSVVPGTSVVEHEVRSASARPEREEDASHPSLQPICCQRAPRAPTPPETPRGDREAETVTRSPALSNWVRSHRSIPRRRRAEAWRTPGGVAFLACHTSRGPTQSVLLKKRFGSRRPEASHRLRLFDAAPGRKACPRTLPVAALHRENPRPPRPLRSGGRANVLQASEIGAPSTDESRRPDEREARPSFGAATGTPSFLNEARLPTRVHLREKARSPSLLPLFGAERERPRAARRFLPYVNELEARSPGPRRPVSAAPTLAGDRV